MQLIPFAYILLVPVLMGWYYLDARGNRLPVLNVLTAMNIMMLLNALYTIRIIIGLIQLMRSLAGNTSMPLQLNELFTEPILRMMGTILFPFVFLIPRIRKNWWISIILVAYTVWNFSGTAHESITIFLLVAELISVFSIVYAVLWLFKKLPTQQITN